MGLQRPWSRPRRRAAEYPDRGDQRDLSADQRTEPGRGPQDLDVSWSPDGTRLAFFRFGDFHPPAP